MTDVSRVFVGREAIVASQTAEPVVLAADLLTGPPTPDLAGKLAGALRKTCGIKSAEVIPAAARPGDEETGTGPARWLPIPAGHDPLEWIIAEFAEPGDPGWAGDGQLHRVTAALSMIGSTARISAGQTPRASPAPEPSLGTQAEMLATVSHELGTPLTTVLSFAELLADTRLDSDGEAAVTAIVRNTRRLLVLVDDLLLLARLEKGRLPLRTGEVDVAQLVAESVDDRRWEAAMVRVTLDCAVLPGPPLTGDASRLQQVLDNILRNAIKFSAPGDVVRVSATRRDDCWVVEVADSGIGIPAAELGRITRGFQRGTNAISAGIPGSGPGLAVCSEVVELHGGTVAIESILEVGTTVRVSLPDARKPT